MRYLKIFTSSLKCSAWALAILFAGFNILLYFWFDRRFSGHCIFLAVLLTFVTYSLMILRVMIECRKETAFLRELNAKNQKGGNAREVAAELEKHLDTMEINNSTKPFMNRYVIMLATFYQVNAEPDKAVGILDRIDKKSLYKADDPNFGVRQYCSVSIASCSYLGEINRLENYYKEAMEYFGKKPKLSATDNNFINSFNINRAIANGSIDEAETLIAPMFESDNNALLTAANVFMARCAAKRGDKQKVCEYFDKAAELDNTGMDKDSLKLRKEYILDRMN